MSIPLSSSVLCQGHTDLLTGLGSYLHLQCSGLVLQSSWKTKGHPLCPHPLPPGACFLVVHVGITGHHSLLGLSAYASLACPGAADFPYGCPLPRAYLLSRCVMLLLTSSPTTGMPAQLLHHRFCPTTIHSTGLACKLASTWHNNERGG